MRRLLPAALFALLLIGAPSTSAAQERPVLFGPQIDWGIDDADFGIGGRVMAQLPETPLGINGSFDYFFPSGNVDYWEINGNLVYYFKLTDAVVEPYAGGGLNIAHASVDLPEGSSGDGSNTDIGINALAGMKFNIATLSSFGEARFEIDGGEQFVLTFGLLF